ncbi:Leucine-rich repeat, ribonuclease inhibitor subtype, partial [Globisporangium splendens]
MLQQGKRKAIAFRRTQSYATPTRAAAKARSTRRRRLTSRRPQRKRRCLVLHLDNEGERVAARARPGWIHRSRTRRKIALRASPRSHQFRISRASGARPQFVIFACTRMAQVVRYPNSTAANAGAQDDDARQFLPPPGIHPNNAVFGAVNLPKPLTWQRREHMIQRRNILGQIGQLLKRNAQLVVGSGNTPATAGGVDVNAAVHAKTWALARKLEVLIFLNSASLMEYSNMDSLSRRVQALTASIVNKKIRRETAADASGKEKLPLDSVGTAAQLRRSHSLQGCSSSSMPVSPAIPGSTYAAPAPFVSVAVAAPSVVAPPTIFAPQVMASPSADTGSPLGGGVGRPLPGIGYLMHHKRSADEMQRSTISPGASVLGAGSVARVTKRMRRSVDLGIFLLRGYEELNSIVWSYVDGTQIMRCRGVSRAAHALAPLFVTSLQLSCNAVQIALATKTGPASILSECVNLKHLEIVSLSSGMTFGKLSMRAIDCPQRFVVTHDDHEQIVLALAEQLRINAFPRLTRLGLTCLFTNEEADGEADVLLNTLMLGCCPQLEELCLPGNSFGDYGAAKVAQMLRSRVCPKLTRLDLRRNFIGEDGIRSMCHTLADGCAPHLVELCLGGNTITDSSFHHILYAMESKQLRNMRFLGIEMNYLTIASMEMLGRTIGKLVCPVLSQISYSDNSVDNGEAKRTIATSVYQERMRQQRRQQQLRDGHAIDDRDNDSIASSDDDDDDEFTSEGE